MVAVYGCTLPEDCARWSDDMWDMWEGDVKFHADYMTWNVGEEANPQGLLGAQAQWLAVTSCHDAGPGHWQSMGESQSLRTPGRSSSNTRHPKEP